MLFKPSSQRIAALALRAHLRCRSRLFIRRSARPICRCTHAPGSAPLPHPCLGAAAVHAASPLRAWGLGYGKDKPIPDLQTRERARCHCQDNRLALGRPDLHLM